jgi:hypothetical protein
VLFLNRQDAKIAKTLVWISAWFTFRGCFRKCYHSALIIIALSSIFNFLPVQRNRSRAKVA